MKKCIFALAVLMLTACSEPANSADVLAESSPSAVSAPAAESTATPRTHRCTYRHAEPNAVGNTYPEPDSNPCTHARRNARTHTGTHRRAGRGSCP